MYIELKNTLLSWIEVNIRIGAKFKAYIFYLYSKIFVYVFKFKLKYGKRWYLDPISYKSDPFPFLHTACLCMGFKNCIRE